MKKTYMAPVTEMIKMDITEQLLTVSGGDKNIGYGGVDEDGEKDPASRRRRDVWDEGEEEY